MSEEEEIIRKGRKKAAKALMEIAKQSTLLIKNDDKYFSLEEMMGSQDVVSSLIKIGMFSIGAADVASLEKESYGGRVKGDPMLGVPIALIGLAFIYATKSCKKDEKGGTTRQGLRAAAKDIERRFGAIKIDAMLMSEISSLANDNAPEVNASLEG